MDGSPVSGTGTWRIGCDVRATGSIGQGREATKSGVTSGIGRKVTLPRHDGDMAEGLCARFSVRRASTFASSWRTVSLETLGSVRVAPEDGWSAVMVRARQAACEMRTSGV